jgi:hypothetical protein
MTCAFLSASYNANPRKKRERGVYQVACHQFHQYCHSSQPGAGAAFVEGAAATAAFTAVRVSLAAAAASLAAPAADLASIPAFLTTDSIPLMRGRMSIWNMVAFTS